MQPMEPRNAPSEGERLEQTFPELTNLFRILWDQNSAGSALADGKSLIAELNEVGRVLSARKEILEDCDASMPATNEFHPFWKLGPPPKTCGGCGRPL